MVSLQRYQTVVKRSVDYARNPQNRPKAKRQKGCLDDKVSQDEEKRH